MTLATSYQLDPARLAHILASIDTLALEVGHTMIGDTDPVDLPYPHATIADLTLLHGWLRALQVEGHLELEVSE